MGKESLDTKMMKKRKKKKHKKILSFVSCLGTQKQKDVMEDQSTKLHKHEQQKDEPICNKPSDDVQQVDRLDSAVSTQPQMQSSLSMRGEEENPDEIKPRKDLIEEIVKHLENKDVCKVVLHGTQGVGKTWIAKEVTKQAILRKLVDVKIWVYLYTKINEKGSTIYVKPTKPYKNIVWQLSAQQDVDGGEYHLIDDEKPDDYFLTSLNEKLEGKTYLLVLDNVLPSAAQNVINIMNKIIDFGSNKSPKVLITTLAKNEMLMTGDDTNRYAVDVEIKPLTASESKDLLHRGTCKVGHLPFLGDDVVKDEIVKQCKYMPAAIQFTGNLLLYALENAEDDLTRELAINGAKKQVDDYWMLGCCSGYDKFTSNVTILRCFLHSTFYLKKYGSINYNELILFWILEGYLLDSTTTSLEKVYDQGHSILMDLLDAGLLGEREAGDVVLENTGLNFANHLVTVFFCEKHLLELSCDYKELRSGGNVKCKNGRIAAFKKSDEEKSEGVNLMTLLVKGNRISKTDQVMINDRNVIESIRVLSVSHAELIINLEHMCESLRVLILRDCHSVNHNVKVSDIANLINLKVLEISECSTLEKIPEDFFGQFLGLQSLNLSGTQIKSFPSSFTPKKLRTLILRRCTQLENFPDVNGLTELQVLDLSGSKLNSLGTKKVWNLEGVPKLKVLNLSNTYIYEFPGLVNLENLTCLLVKDCPLLNKLRPLTALAKLQVIDASGSNDLKFFREINLPSDECLTKLDLSSTMIRKLPPLRNVSNLVYLCLNGCCQLKELPSIRGATSLRVLDASDAIQLEKINDAASFKDMKSLQELLLSNTKINILPPLSGLESLRKLVLRGCKLLQSPPDLALLTNLLLLDLQGCASKTWSFGEQFSHVKILVDKL